MKKFALLLILLFCRNVCSAWVNEYYDVEVDGFYYKINKDNKTASLVTDYRHKYKGDVVIPETIEVDGTVYSVTSLGNSCFSSCYDLTSVTIPNSVTTLGTYCFSGCSGLTSITIPNSVTSLGEYCFFSTRGLTSIDISNSIKSIGRFCFKDCDGLSTITLPNSVTDLGDYCFQNCNRLSTINIPNSVTSLGEGCFESCESLTSITIPNSVTTIGENCFSFGTYPIYAYPCSYTSIEYKYYGRVHLYGGPVYQILDVKSTQTTISMKIKQRTDVDFIPEENGENLYAIEQKVYISDKDTMFLPLSSDNQTVIKELVPNKHYPIEVYVKYSDGNEACLKYSYNYTRGVKPEIDEIKASPTVVTYTARFTPGDAHVKEVVVNGETIAPSLITRNGDNYEIYANETGQLPNTTFMYSITVNTEEGSSETAEATVTTPALELTTLQPKCVSPTCAIVAASTNISEEETNVGFQWKKYDAPASLAPKEGYASVYNGQLEGYIKNLQSDSYYNVRAFYKSDTGNYYYGDWVTFDPSDYSYFEPTVHTYEAVEVGMNSAKVKAYVMAGTEEVVEQGFEYWPSAIPGSKAVSVKASYQAESGVSTVLGTGQVMVVTLTDLQPNCAYTFRSFVKTASGTTYGEERSLITESDPMTGIGNVEYDVPTKAITGYYDLEGRKHNEPQKGLNIIRYSDGSVRKILVE